MNYFIIFASSLFSSLTFSPLCVVSKDEQLTSATSFSSIDFQITMDGDGRTHAHYGTHTAMKSQLHDPRREEEVEE